MTILFSKKNRIVFTGIIENLGVVKAISQEGTNYHFTIQSSLTESLKIDQSVAHNGVCLTVVEIQGDSYTVTAIDETMQLTNLGALKINDKVNLERAMVSGQRLDGHMVQGHVDAKAVLKSIKEVDGSWYFEFEYTPTPDHMVVTKGSICINGVSLTVVEPVDNLFSVAIIPYTYEHTTFHQLIVGDEINLEFDIIGKYLAKYAQIYLAK